MSEIPNWWEGSLPPEPCARIIADSVSPSGRRLTTFEMKFHRFILAEVNTHTLFSRNSASSRAIPLRSKDRKDGSNPRNGMLDRLEDHGPAYPVRWPLEQPGMQGADEQVEDTFTAQQLWENAMLDAIQWAEALAEMGVHKSIANRIIEPFNWHVATITAEDWTGFFRQRSWHHTKEAQPEFATVATQVEDLYSASTPLLVEKGDFHTPYITPAERQEIDLFPRCKVSSARCARTSYLTHDGTRDLSADIDLYEKLVAGEPPHASPFQHVATPDPRNEQSFWIDPDDYGLNDWGLEPHEMIVPIVGNARGWMQFRHILMAF